MDDIKRCSKCGIISLKIGFHKDKNKKDGLKSNCKVCRKKYPKKNVQNKQKRNFYKKTELKQMLIFE